MPCRITLPSSSGSMLPPESTATTGAGEVVRRVQQRGHGRGARPARPPSWPARPARAAARESDSSETVRISSTWLRTSVNGMSPGSPTAMPSAIVFIDGELDRRPVRQRVRVRRGAGGLHADDPHVGAQRLDRQRDPGQQAAATGGHQHGLHVGHLLEHLEPEGALARHDVDVVERVDQHRPGLVGEPPGRRPATPRARCPRRPRRRRTPGWPAPSGSARPRA